LREFCDRRISRLEESRLFALLRLTDGEVFRMTMRQIRVDLTLVTLGKSWVVFPLLRGDKRGVSITKKEIFPDIYPIRG